MNTKILITGGAGFIGSNLSGYFLQKGYRVRCLDNFSTGHRHNVEPFLANPDYELMEADIRDSDSCRRAVERIVKVIMKL